LFGAEAGQQAEFIIQMYSADGQPITSGGIPFTACLIDDECQYHIGIHDNENGSFSSFYVISRPGKYQLHILLNDEHHISGSPFNVEVLPSQTDSSMSIASGNALVSLIPDVISEFTVLAMDAFGNRKQRGGDPFELGVMGPAKLHGLQDNGDGTYTCAVEAHNPAMQSSLTSASLSIMVTLHGKHIHGSPFRPTIDMAAVKKSMQEMQKQQKATAAAMSSSGHSYAHAGGGNGDSSVGSPRGEGFGGSSSTGGTKLESARQRALVASQEQQQQERDRDFTPQELVARAMDDNRGTFDSERGFGNGGVGRAPQGPDIRRGELRGTPVQQERDVAGPRGARPGLGTSGGNAPSETKMKQRLSKLDKMTQKLGSSGRTRGGAEVSCCYGTAV
jgi:hypothetical protein